MQIYESITILIVFLLVAVLSAPLAKRIGLPFSALLVIEGFLGSELIVALVPFSGRNLTVEFHLFPMLRGAFELERSGHPQRAQSAAHLARSGDHQLVFMLPASSKSFLTERSRDDKFPLF